MAFGVCALLFGGAHFFYLNLTVPLVPTWLPPTPTFWAYATGLGHIATGITLEHHAPVHDHDDNERVVRCKRCGARAAVRRTSTAAPAPSMNAAAA